MVYRNELVEFIYEVIGKDLMSRAVIKDEMANGIQVVGGGKVKKVVLGVSVNEDFLKEAVASGANFCVFHHGLDFRVFKSYLPASAQKRLKLVFRNNLTVMGFHYCLDAHPVLGNNAVIIDRLGAKQVESLFDEWGYTAIFEKTQDVRKLADKCAEIFEHDIFAVFSGSKKIKKIGVVSGGAKPYAAELIEMKTKGVELFISGETTESVPHKMKESGINYFAGGHYATEVFGVVELGKVIKQHFKDKLEVEFIDIPNSV